MSAPDDTYDPITFSVMLSRFDSIVNEMTLTLEYTAWTSILAICRDFSCAVYDAAPRQISMYDALPIHTTSLHLVLAEIARTFEGDVSDGDVFMCNDAVPLQHARRRPRDRRARLRRRRAPLLVGHQGPPARLRRVRPVERRAVRRRTSGRRASTSRR